MDFTIAEENVLDDGHVWCILVTGPLTLKDLLKDEAKGRGSQVPRATEIRIPETPFWLGSRCPENMVPGWREHVKICQDERDLNAILLDNGCVRTCSLVEPY